MKKYSSLITFIVAMAFVVGCSNTTSDTQDASINVGDSTQEVITTTVATTTQETTTTTFDYHNLTKDTFNDEGISIYHAEDGFKISDELNQKMMDYIRNYPHNCSFYMVNLEDYATFGYNSDTYIATASTIKCPFAYYCYKEVESGEHSFDEEILYQSGYYSSGTGVLKGGGAGTYYSIEDLLYYMINDSDNVAYLMLQDYFGYEGYNDMISNWGFETYLDGGTKWGKISSHALGYVWTEIYNQKDTSKEIGMLYDTLLNAKYNFFNWPFQNAGYDYKIAHKSGWADPGYHDTGIVLSEHPYVIVVMTDSEGLDSDAGFFCNLTLMINELHDEYLVYLGQEPSSTTPAETTTEETTTTTTEEITTTTTEATTEDTTTVTTVPDTTTTTEATTIITTTEEIVYTTTVPVITVTSQDTPIVTSYADPNQNTQQYQTYDDDNMYF